ncbi:MAG: DUF5050 domain-containing protein [Verrucomicrobiae bacterium]|nr:DUF5050 domain-containing protein [Verrucomicrobiae bacterium]
MKSLRSKSKHALVSACVAAFLILPRAYSQDAALFFTDRGTGKVHRSDPAGDGNQVLATIKFSNLRGIVADVPDGKVYFADNGTNKIYQVNLDGTGLKALVSDLGFPADLTMDRVQRKLYWCDQQKNHIRRCDLDGTAVETVVETEQPYYLDIDPEGGFLYWGTFFKQGRIYRRKINGGKVDTLLAAPTAGIIQVRAVRYNPVDKLLYWVDREAHKIQRAPIKGDSIAAADIEDLYTGLDTPHGMTLDPAAGVLYWCDTGTNRVRGSYGSHKVMRGSLDGKAEPVTIFTGSQPWDIDVYRPVKADADGVIPVPQAIRDAFEIKDDGFYQKYLDASGLPILASEKVDDRALFEARDIIIHMLAGRDDMLEALRRKKVRVGIMAHTEFTTDIPEHSDMNPWWNRRARGLGGNPVTCGEENLLQFPGDHYVGENIFLHEFAHVIHHSGAREVVSGFDLKLNGLYDQAKAAGRISNYAGTNASEFWAEAVQCWFDTNRDEFTVALEDGTQKPLHTREEIIEHMPKLAELLRSVFQDNPWRYSSIADRLRSAPHLAGYDPTTAPTFTWPQAVIDAFDREEARRAKR